jgi:hypothetical protein
LLGGHAERNLTPALLDSPHSLEDAKCQMMVGAQATKILGSLNACYGTNITPVMLTNVKHGRRGGKTARHFEVACHDARLLQVAISADERQARKIVWYRDPIRSAA